MKKLSIKTQVLVLVSASLATLALITTYISSSKSKEFLLIETYKKLETVRDIKKYQAETFFKNQLHNINVLSHSIDVKEIVEDLVYVHHELNVQSEEPYPVANSMAIEKTKKHEEFFQNYKKEYGYYDVFVICAKHGHVMYSASKEMDYGTNLTSGPFKDSGLADAYKSALRNERATFIDMRPYAPSNNKPSLFLASPVVENGKIIAVVALQINDAEINNFMQQRQGYGATQEDYLVGQDKLMRSDSFINNRTHSIEASFANPTKGSIDTEASRAALSGKTGTKVAIGYTGLDVLLSYAPLNINNDFSWAIISRIDEAEILATPNSIRDTIIFWSLGVLIIVIVLSVFIINLSLVRPLEKFKQTLLKIGRNKDLSISIDKNAPLELSQMAQSFNELLEEIKNLIEVAKQGSSENASISHELSTTAMGVGTSVESSVVIVEEATQKANSMKSNIILAIHDAQKSKEEISKATENLNIARSEIIYLAQKVQQSASLETELAQKMETLSQEANEVKNILDIIADIADQTNLLALNAAIEAARAGEHGRGFAVVADEVRKLAERTQRSLTEIHATINVIVHSIGDVSMQMNSNSKDIQSLVQNATGVEDKINDSVSIVNMAAKSTDRTVGDFEKTGHDIEDIVERISSINQISSKNARNVEEIAAAADHLNTMTDELHAKLELFKTK